MYSEKRQKDGQAIFVSMQCCYLTFKCCCYANSVLTLLSLRNSQALHKIKSQLLEDVPAQVAGTRKNSLLPAAFQLNAPVTS